MPSRDFGTLSHKSPNVHAVFERLDPEILHTRLTCPCRAFYQWGFSLSLSFRRKCRIPLRPKYPKIYNQKNKRNIWRKKKEKQKKKKHS